MDAEIREKLEDLTTLTVEDLSTLEDLLGLEVVGLLESPDGDLEEAEALTKAVEDIRGEKQRREEDAAKRDERAAELRARVEPAQPDQGDDGEGEGEEAAEPAEDAQPAPVNAEIEDAPADEAIAAAAVEKPASKPKRPSVAEIAARRPKSMAPRVKPSKSEPVIVAGADLRDVSAGSRVDFDQLGSLYWQRLDSVWSLRGSSRGANRFHIASIQADYPQERVLTASAEENARKISAVTSPQALTASGGICAPLDSRYELTTVATAVRPVRDALAGFNAGRGGLRFMQGPTLSQLDSGVVVWTAANDETPTSPATKPIVTITCPEIQEVEVAAITARARIGNFNRKFFPELWNAWYGMLQAQHAREAEANLLGLLSAGSTAVTDGQNLGAARDILEMLGRAATQYRNRHRMAPDATLRWLAPAWVRDMVREDLSRQLPGDQSMAVAESEINGYLTARNIAASWYIDERAGAGQIFAAQTAAPLLPWITTVESYLFSEGSWLFLDGGTLDLGVEIRDPTLNSTNDVEAFFETFEAAAFVGVESLRIRNVVCVSGASGAAEDINCQGTGS